jgi:mono/diheme cytochrome c family protein
MKRLLFFAMASVLSCRGWESEKPPVHIIRNMYTQEKGKAYRKDTTGLFEDGRVMRAPVEGTVAIGQLGEDDLMEDGLAYPSATDAGVRDAGIPTLVDAQFFPVSLDNDNWDTSVARGKTRYQIYCTPCHGPLLDGKGTVAQLSDDGKPRLLVAPSNLHDARIAKEMVVGKIYSAIRNGVNGNMPSYASQISPEDRWAVVAYVKAEQMRLDATVPKTPGAAPVVVVGKVATAETGAALYKAQGCNACHSLDGTRVVGPTFKGIWGRKEKTDKGEVEVDLAYLTESVLNPNAKIVDGYPPAMPVKILKDIEIASIALFMQTLK